MFDVLLKLVDLLAVELDSHLVRSCDQVRVDLHVQLFTVFVIIVLPIISFHIVLFVAIFTMMRVLLVIFLV